MSKPWKRPQVIFLFPLVLIPIPTVSMAQPASRLTDRAWPRQTVRNGATLITYQPQVDDWDNFQRLQWRMAFSLTPRGGGAVLGVLEAQGLTDVDNDTHMVLIHDITNQNVWFPALDAAASAPLEPLVWSLLPPSIEISLDRIIACTPKKASDRAAQLNNDPPRVFVSYKPAILLDFTGQPAMSAIWQTTLEVALNTSWRLFRNQADAQYYLLAGKQWLTAPDLNGPWNSALTLPADMEKLTTDPFFSDLTGIVPVRTGVSNPTVPTVFYSESPAEVIVFDGQPAYKPIPGTQLSYATNTASYVFRDAAGQIYYLTAGRWFVASSLDGPWSFASPDLPSDFGRIPLPSPAAQVLASVPGTEAARDAVLMAQIPTTALINPQRAAANARVTYDGDPQFAPIEGTSMQYAVNTGQRVIHLGDAYYLCLQGVWFVAGAPEGPWQTAPSVPSQIYTIPPGSPVFNVTYVSQNTMSDGQIEAGYTAGYLGAFVMETETGAVLVNGTGYAYAPYIGGWALGYPISYSYPDTYGPGAYYNPFPGRYGVSQTAYGSYSSAARWGTYNPYTGAAMRGADVSGRYGNAGFTHGYNPYTGCNRATAQGSNIYSDSGGSAVSTGGSVEGIQTVRGGVGHGGEEVTGNTESRGIAAAGDLYAGRDGSVYRHSSSGWEKYGGNGWEPVGASSQGSAARSDEPDSAPLRSDNVGSEIQELDSEAQSRERGAQAFERFRQFSMDRFDGARGLIRR